MAGRSTTKRASQSKRVAQLFYIFLAFLLILVGKADLLVVRTAQNDISELFAPLFDVVSAPVRAVETMFEGVRTVASLREEAMHLRAENDRLNLNCDQYDFQMNGENLKVEPVEIIRNP